MSTSDTVTLNDPRHETSLRWLKFPWRSMLRLWSKDAHVSVRLTREGFQFCFIAAFVLVGAVIRDVNLLIILAGTLLGMLIIQWRVCTRSLHHLSVDRRLPRSIHARKAFEIELGIYNPKAWLGAWLVLAQDRLVYKPTSNSNEPSQGIGLLYQSITPKKLRTQRYRSVVERRGRYQFLATELTSRFPLGLMRGIVNCDDEQSFIAQPAIGRLLSSWTDLFNVKSSGQKFRKAHALSDEGDFFGLRTYRHGDSPRWIHWRSSARREELVVKQFQRAENREMVILLDLHQDKKNGSTKLSQSKLEDLAVEFVSTIANQMVHSNLGFITVAVADSNPGIASRVQSRAQCSGLLDRLAIASGTTQAEFLTALHMIEKEHHRVDHLIVVSTRPRLRQFETEVRPTESSTVFWRSCTWLDVGHGDVAKYFVQAE